MERLPGTGTILAGGFYGLPAVLGIPARPTHHHWHLRLRAGTPRFSCGDGCHCRRPALAPGDYQWEDEEISSSREESCREKDEERKMPRVVGQTQATGFQIGVRKTFPISGKEAWNLLYLEVIPGQIGHPYNGRLDTSS